MSLSDYAKRKALDFAERIFKQADPNANTNTGSGIRSLFLTPLGLINAAVHQDIDALGELYLGNYANISESAMDQLATNLLAERQQGTRSTSNLRLYVSELAEFVLEVFPYFSSAAGAEYVPVKRLAFGINDILEENGEFYVTVPVISTTYGPTSAASSGEINEFRNLPIAATRVTNLNDTIGGEPRQSNTEFFEYIQSKFNDGTPNQIGGIESFIIENYPEVEDIKVVSAGDALMERDEVWTTDGVNPNLLRQGSPFATHTPLGTLSFDGAFGRAYSASGAFTSDMEGKRIAIDGDDEKFRTVIKYIDANNVILSGYDIDGSATAEIWGDGPKILTKADVYLYMPSIQIQSAIVDKRYFLEVTSISGSKIYYTTQEGFGYLSIPTEGVIVISEGTDQQARFNVIGTGTDVAGDYFEVDGTPSATENTPFSLYDMSYIEFGTDIGDAPAIYIMQVDTLDPLSFEVVDRVPNTAPGQYEEPGWYISNTDPAEVFSAKEMKRIVLDDKADFNAFKELNVPLCNITDSTSHFTGTVETTSGDNIVVKAFDWQYMEGREIAVVTDDYALQDETASATGASVSAGAGTGTLTITGLDIEYSGQIGYRDDIRVRVYNSVPTLLNEYDPGDVYVYGDKIELPAGAFSGSADQVDVVVPYQINSTINNFPDVPSQGDLAWVNVSDDFFPDSDEPSLNPYLLNFNGSTWVSQSFNNRPFLKSQTIETVILTTDNTTEIEVLVEGGLPTIKDASGIATSLGQATITADEVSVGASYSPVRVTYATHNVYGALQSIMDDGDVQLLCKDTLIRSFYPSVIDATVGYTGTSSSQEVFDRFIDLVQEVVSEVDEGQNVRIDMSNIIAALDEEGYADSIDVNFEVRVTNYLSDGEYEIRYINPSAATKQELGVDVALAGGEDRVTLRRLKTTATIPGRGKLFMGDNNPSAQEVLPYEAVIDNGDDTFTFVLRQGYTVANAHAMWEGVIVSVRDYDPELEFTDGAIFVPATNRPYVRQLIVIKR